MKFFSRTRDPFVREYERMKVNRNLLWRDARFLALDFEATGLDLRRDDVISFGAVPIASGRMQVGGQAHSYVQPTQLVPGDSSKVHRIRNLDLEGAPDAREATGHLVRMLTGRALIAHAAWVEVAFLKRLLTLQNTKLVSPVIDTAALARVLELSPRIASHEPQLEALAESLGVPVHDPHHALGDALTTAQVFLVLVSRLEREFGLLTVDALEQMSRLHTLLRP